MLSVLYEDSDILVAVKPAGVESQSARGFAKDMVSEIRRYLTIQARNPQNIHKLTTLSSKGQGKNQPPYVGVIHRFGPACVGNYGVCQKSKGCSFS